MSGHLEHLALLVAAAVLQDISNISSIVRHGIHHVLQKAKVVVSTDKPLHLSCLTLERVQYTVVHASL